MMSYRIMWDSEGAGEAVRFDGESFDSVEKALLAGKLVEARGTGYFDDYQANDAGLRLCSTKTRDVVQSFVRADEGLGVVRPDPGD